MSTARTEKTDYWRLDGAAGAIPFDYRSPATRALTPGDDMPLQVVLSGFSDPPDGSDAWGGWEARFHSLVDTYAGHAGEFDVHDPDIGQVAYTETHNAASLLVAIRPPSGMASGYGAWTLIKSMQDNTRPGRANVQCSLVYLSPLSDYQTRTELAFDLEADTLSKNLTRPMAYREYHNGDAWITADENNERNAARGTMVRSGGTITIAASSSEPLLSIATTEFRVAEQDYSLGSDTEPLPANPEGRPRRDLVIARKPPDETSGPSYDVLPGEPIDSDLLERLQNSNQPDGARIDGEGLPIHPPESIPQVQPPEATGLRDEATVLGMVYVPPGTADSTDLADEYITDLRREGIGVEGVLRTGDAVEEAESHPDALAIDITGTAGDAAMLDGEEVNDYARARELSSLITGSNFDYKAIFDIPETQSSSTFGAYRAEVAAVANYTGNDAPVYLVADVAVVNSSDGYNLASNVVTAIGVSDSNVTLTGNNDLSINFNGPSGDLATSPSFLKGDLWLIRGVR